MLNTIIDYHFISALRRRSFTDVKMLTWLPWSFYAHQLWSDFMSFQTAAVLQSLPVPWEKLPPRQSWTSRLPGLQPHTPALARVVSWDPVTAGGGLGWQEEALESPNPSAPVTTGRPLACSCTPARISLLSSGRHREPRRIHPRQQTHCWAVRRVSKRKAAEVRW